VTPIHIADPSGRQTSYSEEQARALWSQGGIAPQSLYWKEGMPEWRPATEFFGVSPAPTAAPVGRGFIRDPAGLTRWVVRMMWLLLGLSALAGVVTAVSLGTGNARRGMEELTAIDVVEAVIALGQVVVYITTGVCFLRWVHRANLNARGFGAEGMRFSPGWCVGWYFVPILNLWKPYQAMKEIWQASRNPVNWWTVPPPGLLSLWWTLWLLSNLLAQLSFRATLGNLPDAVGTGLVLDMASNLIDVPLCFVAIRMVQSIHQMQSDLAREPR
jgi:hypothetical protein